MESKSTFLWWILIIVVAGTVFWWFGVFSKTRDFIVDLGLGNNLKTSSVLESLVKKTSQPNDIKSQTFNIVDKLTELPKNIAVNAVDSVKESVVQTIKEQIGQALSSLQQRLGLPVTSGGGGSGGGGQEVIVTSINQPPLTVALIGNQNKPLNFFIEGDGNDIGYSIDWGDGTRSSGQVKAPEKKTVDHIWRSTGPYLVVAEVVNKNKEVHKFSFPIVIE